MPCQRTKTTPFLFAFLLLAPQVVQAQQGWAIVGITQTSRGEMPDRPVLITLQFRGNAIQTTFCDSEGKFAFSQLSANPYHVLVNDDKFRPIDELVNISPQFTGPTFVRITLTPKDAPKNENPPSGSNPNMVNSVEFTKQIPKAALKEYDKGRKADKDGFFNDAIGHYQKALKLAPQFYAARNNLGSAYLSKSQFPAAQEQFEEVIRINPSDATAYFNLGNLCLLTQKFDESDRWLQQGLSKEPNSALGHFLLGSVYTRTQKLGLAEKELKTSLELNPKMAKPHLGLVNLYLQQGRSADAIDELRQFLKAAPDDPFAPKARDVLEKLEKQSAHAQKR